MANNSTVVAFLLLLVMFLALPALFVSVIQLLFCFKSKKIAVKLIPIYLLLIIIVVFVISAMDINERYLHLSSPAAIIYGLLFCTLFAGDAVAWIIWAVYSRYKNKKEEKDVIQS